MSDKWRNPKSKYGNFEYRGVAGGFDTDEDLEKKRLMRKKKEVDKDGDTEDKEDACPSMRQVREYGEDSCRQCFFYMQKLCDKNTERKE